MTEALAQFLDQKGVCEILCVMPMDGVGFNELERKVRISPATLSKRLETGAQEHDLWGTSSAKHDDPGNVLYVPKQPAKQLKVVLSNHRLPEVFVELREKDKMFSRQKESVTNLVAENGLADLNEVYSEE